ncbi:MAG: hypothetical protein AVDCRST_MAG25-1946 [uncultured Rubrobacteraceae bacterium]|uniref:MOSC domain-containing protein n=1 Tax=uncultured Rubrobacteraceae bacterium TaxID=349277 RepID=A0A6J4RBU2_9ACTN|nr:MAG: hypothetical protein AVDCRST_MAG25-1946 [uncultured Rubrobacteraceae bacterium]
MSRGSKAAGKITGEVEAIYITPSAGEPMRSLTEAEAIAGQGLVGDRYLEGAGYYSNRPLADGSREITLIESEELEGIERETGIRLHPSESRRNVLTRSVRVNTLIGKRFRMGEVVCEGIRICEPCTYLEKLTGKRVMRPLVHKGGLRARIVSGGTVRVGDGILVSSENPARDVAPAAGVQSSGTETADHTDPREIHADGILRKLEYPSSEGGSHCLRSEGAETVEYALVSEELELDDYLGVNVRAFGYLVHGTSGRAEDHKLMNVFLIGAL